MNLVKLLAAGASALALTACAVGPNYVTPRPMPSTEGGFVSGGGPAFTAEAPPQDWWRLFDDKTLDGLVEQALAENKDIAVAAANLARVRAQLSESRSARLPSTTASASGGRARTLNSATNETSEDDFVSVGFDLAYEVDFFGRVTRSIQAARADRDAAQAALDVVRVAVASETARAYADACSANAQLAVARRTLNIQQEAFDLTQRQLDAGAGTRLDTARAASLLETTRATLSNFQAQHDNALFRLAVLTGRPPAEAPEAAKACATAPHVATAIPTGDGAGLLARRPDVRQAERQLAAATARIGVATAALFPQVSLGGSIGSSSERASGLGGDNFTFSVGPLVSWSFPNITVARARIRQAGAAADGALATFEKTNLTALQEAETALTTYARELDRRAALAKAASESAEAARLARMRFDAGADSFLTVLDAERTRASADAQLAASQALVANDQIAVFKALGGGWARSE